jgi:hypothetical protein
MLNLGVTMLIVPAALFFGCRFRRFHINCVSVHNHQDFKRTIFNGDRNFSPPQAGKPFAY